MIGEESIIRNGLKNYKITRFKDYKINHVRIYEITPARQWSEAVRRMAGGRIPQITAKSELE
jgi:hypothetical protein